jgi:hypothetical protein
MGGIYLIASFKTLDLCCFMYGCGEGSLLALQVVELFQSFGYSSVTELCWPWSNHISFPTCPAIHVQIGIINLTLHTSMKRWRCFFPFQVLVCIRLTCVEMGFCDSTIFSLVGSWPAVIYNCGWVIIIKLVESKVGTTGTYLI